MKAVLLANFGYLLAGDACVGGPDPIEFRYTIASYSSSIITTKSHNRVGKVVVVLRRMTNPLCWSCANLYAALSQCIPAMIGTHGLNVYGLG